ncbi:hypothetical protein J6590_072849, partial [Homalodisca vitripennis]
MLQAYVRAKDQLVNALPYCASSQEKTTLTHPKRNIKKLVQKTLEEEDHAVAANANQQGDSNGRLEEKGDV